MAIHSRFSSSPSSHSTQSPRPEHIDLIYRLKDLTAHNRLSSVRSTKNDGPVSTSAVIYEPRVAALWLSHLQPILYTYGLPAGIYAGYAGFLEKEPRSVHDGEQFEECLILFGLKTFNTDYLAQQLCATTGVTVVLRDPSFKPLDLLPFAVPTMRPSPSASSSSEKDEIETRTPFSSIDNRPLRLRGGATVADSISGASLLSKLMGKRPIENDILAEMDKRRKVKEELGDPFVRVLMHANKVNVRWKVGDGSEASVVSMLALQAYPGLANNSCAVLVRALSSLEVAEGGGRIRGQWTQLEASGPAVSHVMGDADESFLRPAIKRTEKISTNVGAKITAGWPGQVSGHISSNKAKEHGFEISHEQAAGEYISIQQPPTGMHAARWMIFPQPLEPGLPHVPPKMVAHYDASVSMIPSESTQCDVHFTAQSHLLLHDVNVVPDSPAAGRTGHPTVSTGLLIVHKFSVSDIVHRERPGRCDVTMNVGETAVLDKEEGFTREITSSVGALRHSLEDNKSGRGKVKRLLKALVRRFPGRPRTEFPDAIMKVTTFRGGQLVHRERAVHVVHVAPKFLPRTANSTEFGVAPETWPHFKGYSI